MKKKILSVMLCLAMLIPALAMVGCDIGSSGSGEQKIGTTITLYSIKGENMTDEAIEAVQKELNQTIENEFGVRVVLKLFEADEYDEVLNDNLKSAYEDYQAKLEAAENGEKVEETEIVTTEKETTEPETDENGETVRPRVFTETSETVYPEEGENQVDILLINNIDNFNTFVSKGYVISLEDYLLGNNRIINKFVNPVFQHAAKSYDITYAVADNYMVGEYEYLLLNKKLIDSYFIDPTTISTLSQLEPYITKAKATNPDYMSILDTYGVEPLSISITGEDSLFGSYLGSSYNAGGSTNAMPEILLGKTGFQKDMQYIKSLTDAGSLVRGEMAPGKQAAAVFLRGDVTAADAYTDDYYVQVYKKPMATNENVYSGMYAISASCKSIKTCMEILEMLQTDADFRNTFQYGVEDENYTIDDDNFVTILNHDWDMDYTRTGNQFIMYQNNEMTDAELALSANDWELGKKHNMGIVESPYLRFSANTTEVVFENEDVMEESDYTTKEILKSVSELSDTYEEKLANYATYAGGYGVTDYTAYMNALAAEFESQEIMKYATSNKYFESPFALYVGWYKVEYKTTSEG